MTAAKPVGATALEIMPAPVHVALANVARRVAPVSKRGTAPSQMGGFSFRKYDDIVDAIHEAMADEGVIPFYEMLAEPRHEQWSEKMHRLVVPVKFRFIGPAGDELVTDVWCEALDNGDKGIGKAVSYALKDLLTRMLTLPFGTPIDNEDTDAPPRSSYDDGYQRTVDPPVEGGITAVQRDEIQLQIDMLTDEQRALLAERWAKLTEARALRTMKRLRPSELPAVNDLLANVKRDAPPCDTDDANSGGAVPVAVPGEVAAADPPAAARP
jgi:ERF superfamily